MNIHKVFPIVFCLTLFACSNHSNNKQVSSHEEKVIVRPRTIGKYIFIKGEKIKGNYILIVGEDSYRDISIVKKGLRYGLIDKNKQIILPIEYDNIRYQHLGTYFYITKNNLTGVVTDEGYLNIPIMYESILYDWKENVSDEYDCFIVQKNKKLGSVDYYNNIIIPIEFDGISNWVEYGPDAHYVKKNNLYGLIDYNSGELIIPVIYDGLRVCDKYCIEVKKNGHYGVVSQKNKIIIPCIYDKVFVDLDYLGFEENHKNRILAEKNRIWYEFKMNGKIARTNVSATEIDKDILTYKPDSNEYRYHLKDCMVFPK
jgi:hypothetical protein